MSAQAVEAIFYRGEQDRTDYTPSGSNVANGEVIDIGGTLGVCTSPEGITDGDLGSLAVTGVFKLKKAEGTGVTFAKGAKVWWDTSNNTSVAAIGANIVFAGIADEAAVTGDNHVKCNLNVVDGQGIESRIDALENP